MTEQATELSATATATASTNEAANATAKNNDAATTTTTTTTISKQPSCTSTLRRPTKKRRTNDSSSVSKLVTLRVDVPHAGNIRLVDTLILDSSCWPLPPGVDDACTHTRTQTQSYPPFLEQNAYELAHHLLSDMEVHGMGRTARHFTGRVDLYHGLNTFAPPLKGSTSSKTLLAAMTKSPPLLEKIVQQLLPQLQRVWDDYVAVVDDDDDEEETQNKEKKNVHSTPQNDKKEHQEPSSSMTNSGSQMTTTTTTTNNNITKRTPSSSSSSNHTNNNNIHLRTIQIQLSIHGIMVMDEFQWDPQHPFGCPFEFAYQMTRDLKLPIDAAVPIATCIIEQLNDHVVITGNSDASTSTTATSATITATDLPPIPSPLLPPSLTTTTTSSSLSNPSASKMVSSSTAAIPMSAAWTIDPREHIANISSMIHQQRPPGFSTTTNASGGGTSK